MQQPWLYRRLNPPFQISYASWACLPQKLFDSERQKHRSKDRPLQLPPSPGFSVSVAFKGFGDCVKALKSTLMGRFVSVASKGVTLCLSEQVAGVSLRQKVRGLGAARRRFARRRR